MIWMTAVILTVSFISCSEVKEAGEYDNWRERNEAYVDSLLQAAGPNLFSEASDTAKIDEMELGKLFGIQTRTSTTETKQYVFCKKLTATDGRHPLFTDYVSAFYRGSYMTGRVFDGNFEGYVATDGHYYGDEKLPQVYDTPATFQVSGLVVGWITALQYMREGERWILYVPYQSGYGTTTTGGVLGYSTLFFDLILNNVVK